MSGFDVDPDRVLYSFNGLCLSHHSWFTHALLCCWGEPLLYEKESAGPAFVWPKQEAARTFVETERALRLLIHEAAMAALREQLWPGVLGGVGSKRATSGE